MNRLFAIFTAFAVIFFAFTIGQINSAFAKEQGPFTYTKLEVIERVTQMHRLRPPSPSQKNFSKWGVPIRYQVVGLDRFGLEDDFHAMVSKARDLIKVDIQRASPASNGQANMLFIFTDSIKKTYLDPSYRKVLQGRTSDKNYLQLANQLDRLNKFLRRRNESISFKKGDQIRSRIFISKPTKIDEESMFRMFNSLIYSSLYFPVTEEIGFWNKSVFSSTRAPDFLTHPTPFDVGLLSTIYDRVNPIPTDIKTGLPVLIKRTISKLRTLGALVEQKPGDFVYSRLEVLERLAQIHRFSGPDRPQNFGVWEKPVRYWVSGLPRPEQETNFHEKMSAAAELIGIDVKRAPSFLDNETNLHFIFSTSIADAFNNPRYRKLFQGNRSEQEYKQMVAVFAARAKKEGIRYEAAIKRSTGELAHRVYVYKFKDLNQNTTAKIFNTLIHRSFFSAKTIDLKYWKKSVFSSLNETDLLPHPTPFDIAFLSVLYDQSNPVPSGIKNGLPKLFEKTISKMRSLGALSE